ncbi:hypothetical protein SCD_n02151 [Sulfuricella denitrificans skB26]|uniref:Secreted protein n=1 Tax=Sulfuricella denitrificans (strain DSM 22764 / NBRC 105220 / skB26) TaxID=1163617 RepID=S6AAJ3_SULDS|nr:hypothetical protein [Sulfuricella denitrificans]BAN35960.1 hypothetical protein SCD_n02151 [Sulfuricella denitrificans skB26]
MQKITEVFWSILVIMLLVVSAPLRAQGAGEPPQAAEQRELIYCADKMTHEEREAYRASMRAARTPEEKAALRQAHQQEMQARARQSGGDAEQCIPLRLRQRGGRSQ